MTKKQLIEALADVKDDEVIYIGKYEEHHGVTYYEPLLNVSKEQASYYTNPKGYKIYMDRWTKGEGNENIVIMEAP